jgi:hypothetical protein
MTLDAAITAAILTVTFGLLIKTRLPPAAVFLGALTAALTFDLAPPAELLKGFRNQGMLTVGVLFMVAAGMYSTGAITMLMDKIIGLPRRLTTAQLKILPPIAVGSAFLNNTPLVAMMIPVIQDLARTCRLPAKHLYIPLSFASILGGACTLIGTSTNLVIGGLILEAINKGGSLPEMRPVTIFDPALVAAPIAVAGIVFMLVFGRLLLPKDTPDETDRPNRRWYRAEFEIHAKSRLRGKTIAEAGIAGMPGARLISITRGAQAATAFDDFGPLEAGDVMAFAATRDALLELWKSNKLHPHIRPKPMQTERHTHHLVKAVVARRNRAVGHFVSELPITNSKYNYRFVAVSQDGQAPETLLRRHRIAAGDTLVLEVNDSFFFDAATEDREFALTKAPGRLPCPAHRPGRWRPPSSPRPWSPPWPWGWMSMLKAAPPGQRRLMLLTGCIDTRSTPPRASTTARWSSSPAPSAWSRR